MEQIISNLPRLKHLQFQSVGDVDLYDGQRWETIAANLSRLDFKFLTLKQVLTPDLESFRSSFWLEERQWFVAFSGGYFFTVPFFSNTDAMDDYQPPTSSTSSEETIYDNITALTIVEAPVNIRHRFNHVQTLTIVSSILPSHLEQTVDLSEVRHLILSPRTSRFEIAVPVDRMSNLARVTINVSIQSFLKGMTFQPMENIRQLSMIEASDESPDDDVSIQELSSVFPSVQQLHIAHMCSPHQLFAYLDAFKHVLVASFVCETGLIETATIDDGQIDLRSELDRKQLSGELNFTYRFKLSSVYLWLTR